jgi:oligoribonuclease NrnB/cAMP/cGMP phosphodiesterase (DHH superfamily)
MLCIHHNDLDGRCSAAIVKLAFPAAKCLELGYEDPIPWELIKGERVWIVDFAFQPFEHMIRAAQSAAALTWIDHHKASIDAAKAAGFEVEGLQEIGRAGCELTWAFVRGDDPEPQAVRLLGRFDVWDHEDPEVLPFQFAMRGVDDTSPGASILWDRLLSADDGPLVAEFVKRGAHIQEYQRVIDRETVEDMAFETEIDGLRAIACNAQRGSELFASVFDPSRHDLMLSFRWVKGRWTVSLYSPAGSAVDVAKICAAYGGGGHANAGGFQSAKLPFELPAIR